MIEHVPSTTAHKFVIRAAKNKFEKNQKKEKKYIYLKLPVNHCFRGCLKINVKVYDIINCLNKNLMHFV